MTSRTWDVAIIGGGIVGTACAAEMVSHCARVAVIDDGPVGGGASAASMGHIVVMDDSEAQLALTRYSRQLWQELSPELPDSVECERRGTLWLAVDDEEMEEARRKHAYLESRGVSSVVIDEPSLAEAEPNLKRHLPGGLLVPDDLVLYPPCAAEFLFSRAQQKGAQWISQRAVAIGKGTVELADGTKISAGVIINAAGDAAQLLTLGIKIKKRKGHLVITDRYPGLVTHQLVELGYIKNAHAAASDSVAFNVQPRKTGQLLIGSSRQFDVESREVQSIMLTRMLRRVAEYFPKLSELSAIRVWTGFRSATPDNLPLIGPSPEDSSVYLATGHEGLGITTSLATAKLLAQQLFGISSAISAEPYFPARQLAEHAHA